ncbi:MAG: hypothetical protein K6F58_06290 [Bacteroidales bacterium]|nr:hypothetical protein [Bacteroidales bacterium]
MKSFYHWCSKGLKNDLFFTNDREFIAGMNRIAACYLYCMERGRPVRIVAFCLLNNHFHFVLYGEEEDTILFMNHYWLLTAIWIQNHRKERLHGRVELGHWKAETRESVRDKVVYTMRQTLEAGLQVTPQAYPWCSARLMYNNNESVMETSGKMAEMGVREKRRKFFTMRDFPHDWSVLPNGMIWPGCYTDTVLAHKLFSGVKDFMFSMNNGNVDREVNVEIMAEMPSIPDTEVKHRAESLARSLFGRQRISSCPAEERIRIASMLRKELHCGHKQLARIVMMREEDLRKTV